MKALTLNLAQVNILFMILSATLALLLPFELVLLSYAILGPMHYLTEIAWLHQRQYFTAGTRDYWLLVAIVIAVLYLPPAAFANAWVLVAFAVAGVLSLRLTAFQRWYFVAALTYGLLSLAPRLPITEQLAQLLITVVHVYIFTGMFILAGALKRKDGWDIVSLLVFSGCGIALVYWPMALRPGISDYVDQSSKYFQNIGNEVGGVLGLDTELALPRLMAFLSFAYTYHYLNWFSKTRIIGWHKLPPLILATIVLIYGFSLAVYAYDFVLGFKVLLFLSLLHVVLEFPLNVQTARIIARESKGFIGARRLPERQSHKPH